MINVVTRCKQMIISCVLMKFLYLCRLVVVYIGLLFIKSNEKHNTNDRREA